MAPSPLEPSQVKPNTLMVTQLTGGVSAPATVPAVALDSTLQQAVIVATIDPPAGYLHPDLVKFVNQDQHLFVVWDDADGSNSNMGGLYDVSDGSLVYSQILTGSVSHNDICWDAKAADEFLLLRSANGVPELSKWNATQRVWSSNKFDTSTTFSWCGGIKQDGARSMIQGWLASSPTGWDMFIMDGADDTVSSTHNPITTSLIGACGALSRDGDIVITKPHSDGFTIYKISTTTELHANTTARWFGMDTAFDPAWHGNVGISADGNEAIVIDDAANSVVCVTAVLTTPVSTEIFLPNRPRACALSSDGSTAVVISRASDNDNGGLTVTVIDMTGTPSIATTSGGLPIQYPVLNPTGTAHGRCKVVGITDDGAEIGWVTDRNVDQSTGTHHENAFRADTTKRSYQRVFTNRQGWRSWCGDYATSDGSLMAVGQQEQSFPAQGNVVLLSLP